MATYEILLAIPEEDDEITSVESLAKEMDAAINEVGLFSGNFLIRKVSDNCVGFWQEWNKRVGDENES